jgi:adenylylsulfate kinase
MRASTGQNGAILWFTGLSGSGKSTLAAAVAGRLTPALRVEILDGDEIRKQLHADLGFTKEDRDINIRRIGFIARLLAHHGVFVITAAISPYAATRLEMRQLACDEGIPFLEVFLSARLATLVARDAKGLYKRALAGELLHFSGVSDPYEAPMNPDAIIHTDHESVQASTQRVLALLVERGLAKTPGGETPGGETPGGETPGGETPVGDAL